MVLPMTATNSISIPSSPRGVLRRVLAAPFSDQTYKNLLYLLVAFPLGIAYFTGLVAGGALGIGLLITGVGLPILILTISGATVAAGIEAWLARELVGVDASVPSVLREGSVRDGLAFPGDGFADALKHLLTAPSTWTSVVLLLSKFVFGVVSFVAVVVSAATTGALLAAPFVYDDPDIVFGLVGTPPSGQYRIGAWVVSTLPEAMIVAGIGVILALLALNGLKVLARLQATYTAALLGVDRRNS